MPSKLTRAMKETLCPGCKNHDKRVKTNCKSKYQRNGNGCRNYIPRGK